MDALEPFDYSNLREFSMNYLSGFLAEKYDVDRKDVFPRIKKRVDDNTEALIRNSMQYDRINMLEKNIVIEKTDWEYVMMPVWFLTYKFNDTNYYFAMNGETGKVMVFRRVSETPYMTSIETADASAIANNEKYLPDDFINSDGNNITDIAINYFLPLIQGEPDLVMEMGVPKHFTLQESVLK